MKRFLSLLLVLLLLSGCSTSKKVTTTERTYEPWELPYGDEEDYTPPATTTSAITTKALTTTKITTTATTTQAVDDDPLFGYTSNGIAVELVGAERVQEDGKNLLVVNYLFINGSDEEKSFSLSIYDKVYQNGIQCDTSYSRTHNDSQSQVSKILPGYQIEVKTAYELTSSDGDVDIVVTDLFGTEELISITLDKDNNYVTFIPSSSPSGELSVIGKSAYIDKDYKGDPVLIVEYEFTHYANEPKAFIFTVSDVAYQNGIELGTAILRDSVDTSTRQNEVMAGIPYTVYAAYELSDTTSPVLIKVDKWLNFDNSPPILELEISLT